MGKGQAMPKPTGVQVAVMALHFEDRSGSEFERLCLAYLVQAPCLTWKTIAWYGQLGGDRGRDIWAVRPTGEAECFQCANHQTLKFKKAEEDLAKVVAGRSGVPTKFTLILGGKVSAAMREKVIAHALKLGIAEAEVWSGTEFEERLRRDAPGLVKRFFEGEPFPETVEGLRAMSLDGEVSDDEALALMAECFDRPAFTIEFRSESNIPDFKKAITDTIEALNTGVRRLRDGTEMGRIPRKAQLKDPAKRKVVEEVVELLVDLRARFDGFVSSGDIRKSCGSPDCTLWDFHPRAAFVMDDLRERILHEFGRVAPVQMPKLRRRGW
jgi:hypothetical protein